MARKTLKRPAASLKRPAASSAWHPDVPILQVMIILHWCNDTFCDLTFVAEWPNKPWGATEHMKFDRRTTLAQISHNLCWSLRLTEAVHMSFRIPHRSGKWRTIEWNKVNAVQTIDELFGIPEPFDNSYPFRHRAYSSTGTQTQIPGLAEAPWRQSLASAVEASAVLSQASSHTLPLL